MALFSDGIFHKKAGLSINIGLISIFLFLLAFFFLNLSFVSSSVRNLLFIAYALLGILSAAVYLLSTGRYGKIGEQAVQAVFLVLAGGVLSFLNIRVPVDNAVFYQSGLMILILSGYLLFRFRRKTATAAGWLIFIVYNFMNIGHSGIHMASVVYANFFLVVANLVGMYVRYFRWGPEKGNIATSPLDENDDITKIDTSSQLSDLNHELALTKSTMQVERLISSLAMRFIALPPEKIEDMIRKSLNLLAGFTSADRAYIYVFRNHGTDLEIAYEWCGEEINPKINRHERVNSDDFSWFINTLKSDGKIQFSGINELPPAASTVRAIFSVEGIKSLIIAPIISKKTLIGLVGIDSVKEEKRWPQTTIHLVKNAGRLFDGVLERKKVNDKRKRTEERLRTLFERSEDVVFISTPEGKIIDINPSGARMFGYSSIEELMQVNISKQLYLDPEQRKQYHRMLEKNGHVRDFELTLKTKDGQKLVVLETTTAVKDETGNIVAYEGIMRDVTERKKLEQQLLQAQKMESIGLLAGGVAHDFNNILTAINGYADMMLMKMDPTNPAYSDLMNIVRGGKRAERLTRQLLAFSRKQVIEPRIIDINKLILDLDSMLRRLIGEDIQIETCLNEELAHIKADPGQIEQILVNLVINATYAINQNKTPNADKKITIGTELINLDDAFVRMHPGSKKGAHVVISVSDTGVGMDEETKNKIFEPFFTTKQKNKGTGLGLSTVYGIVKQNDGSVYVESEAGKGSVFKIYWQATDMEASPDTFYEISDSKSAVTETILVVEDDEDVRDLACSYLKILGYNVMEAQNGVKALDMMRDNDPDTRVDLLFSDIVMPEMGGEELAKKIKAMIPTIKIILTSGYTDSQMLHGETLKKGISFLSKPYTIEDMKKKIRSVLDN
ncbi:MAG: PAS domain S-box protein [Calditrichaceae bacterium]